MVLESRGVEPFMSFTITCPHCSSKQNVKVSAVRSVGLQTVGCAKCKLDFEVDVHFEIIEGPFLAAPQVA